MSDKLNSAADNAYETSTTPDRSVSTDYPVSVDGANPKINTVSDADVGSTPSPNSGSQQPATVKTVNLPDEGGNKIRSAAG